MIKILLISLLQLGWSIGPEHLVKHLQTVMQSTLYTSPTPLQARTVYTRMHALTNSVTIRNCLMYFDVGPALIWTINQRDLGDAVQAPDHQRAL